MFQYVLFCTVRPSSDRSLGLSERKSEDDLDDWSHGRKRHLST